MAEQVQGVACCIEVVYWVDEAVRGVLDAKALEEETVVVGGEGAVRCLDAVAREGLKGEGMRAWLAIGCKVGTGEGQERRYGGDSEGETAHGDGEVECVETAM